MEIEKYNSYIFESLIHDLQHDDIVESSIEQMDETECVDVKLDDQGIDNSECSIIAYGLHVSEDDDSQAYNPKNNPDKAIDIFFKYPDKNLTVEVFLDTNSAEWDSWVNGKNGKISPEQMEQFFKSNFYNKITQKLEKEWPCNEDEMFSRLMDGLKRKKYRTEFQQDVEDDDTVQNIDEKENIERRRHNVKLGKPNEKDHNGNKIRSSSGRKLISFSDMGVANTKFEAYYSWPGAYLRDTNNIDNNDEDTLKKVFKWSRWCDWEKQRPFLRFRFGYNVSGGSSSADIIGGSLSLHTDENPNRGWKTFDLSLEPILQYLTPEETQQILDLSLIRRFQKECLNRILPLLKIPDEEIYKRINKPEKCTIDDIRKTKRVVQNTLKAVRDPTADTFVYF